MSPEQLIRTYYSGYEKKDWNVSDGVLADNFTFTSPNGGDHARRRSICEIHVPHHKEHLVDGKIASIECYFGGQLGYPAAAATGKS